MRPPEFWSRSDTASRSIAAALAPFGLLYGASIAWKHRWALPYRSRAAVVCVGNLTVGGSGKTPLAIAIVRTLQDNGQPVACLTRGHGRTSVRASLVDVGAHDAKSVGDEALLLAQAAHTVVAADRAHGARLAEALGARVIVMDDGHQNFTLAKDLSLVVVDGETAFGNGNIVPAGPLRESVHQGLSRADAVIIMGDGDPALPGFAGPTLRARLSAARRFDGRRVVAFAGIGRPTKFFSLLRTQGAELAECHSYGDHHFYSASEIALLQERAKLADATLVTTEKDFVRLSSSDQEHIEVLPVKATFDEPGVLSRLLDPLLATSRDG